MIFLPLSQGEAALLHAEHGSSVMGFNDSGGKVGTLNGSPVWGGLESALRMRSSSLWSAQGVRDRGDWKGGPWCPWKERSFVGRAVSLRLCPDLPPD